MALARITKRFVNTLKCAPGKDRTFVWDASLSGFGVAVFPSGKKTYVAQFRLNGRSQRVAIGKHGRITPDEARSRAKRVLGRAESGEDLAAQRKAARKARPFRELTAEFLDQHIGKKRKQKTKADYASLLRLYILPALGAKRIYKLRKSPQEGHSDAPTLV